MGRPDKPHERFEMRFDADIFQRLKTFVDDVNSSMSDYKTNRTEVTEILIACCLLNYDDSMRYVREEIAKIRQGR